MKTHVLLIGGFDKARALAVSLIKKGYRVSAINNTVEDCKILTEIPKLTVYYGDGTKPLVLEDADAYNVDIAIALTDFDEDNLVACQLCKKKFKIKKTVSLIADPKKIEFFYSMGVDSVVSAISAIANVIEQQAFLDEMSTLVPIGEGQISLAQVSIPATAPIVNKKLMEINLPKDVIVGCILRHEHSIVPHGNTQVLAGDILVLLSANKKEMAAIKELTGR